MVGPAFAARDIFAERDMVVDANTLKPVVQHLDANDLIYQFEASRDYDQINPPEHGRFVLLPIAPDTRGHGTHTGASTSASCCR
jgi:hypothetical protein